jgi:parallel beta-helix repeat protein
MKRQWGHPRPWKTCMWLAVWFGAALGAATEARSRVIRVPQDVPGIQAAINAAASGDTVLVSPGTYSGGLVLSGKTLTLASLYITSHDPNHITQTTIDGGAPILTIDASVGPNTTVQGLTFRNGDYQVVNHARRVNILNDRFLDGSGDQLSFESAGGLVRACVFDNAGDDGIDSDNASDPTVENCTITNAGDDGIELRLHSYTGPTLAIVFRSNTITGCSEDGIQLIDYPGASSRSFTIEGNVLAHNTDAGLGCMADGNSTENLAGAPLVEPVRVIGNTFSGNPCGITGGDNMLVMNNIFVGATQIGAKRVAASSLVTYNDFWGNATDYAGSNVNAGTTRHQNPMLDPNYNLQPGSPCIDAGVASITWNGTVVSAPPYSGAAPDLGAHETGSSVSVGDLSAPGELVLTGVRPNPSRSGFAVAFSLPGAALVHIEIMDLQGRRIFGRELEGLGRADHLVALPETRSLPAGVYVVRLSQGGHSRSKLAVVVR